MMMVEGLIVDFSHQGHNKWVVVNVNDCRATVIPLMGKNPNDPSEVFEEAHPAATGISPNSDCKSHGFVKGQIRKREYRNIVTLPRANHTNHTERPEKPKPVEKPKLLLGALPSIPEDPCPHDPVIDNVLTSTRGLFSSKGH
jgi:hypothetical protein